MNRGVTLYTNGVARATPSKKSATPSLRLPPHHLAPYTGRPRVMKAPARTKERAHGQKVPKEARNEHKQVASNRKLKKMLSLLLKRAPLAGRAPHRLINAPCEVSAPLWPVTSFISYL